MKLIFWKNKYNFLFFLNSGWSDAKYTVFFEKSSMFNEIFKQFEFVGKKSGASPQKFFNVENFRTNKFPAEFLVGSVHIILTSAYLSWIMKKFAFYS